MVKKNKLIIFTETDAIIKILPDVYGYEESDTVKINPDLSKVKNIHKHFWKVKDGEIVEMTRPEKIARLKMIGKQNNDPGLVQRVIDSKKRHFKTEYLYATFMLGFVLGVVVNFLI
jgi:hypothetical protein